MDSNKEKMTLDKIMEGKSPVKSPSKRNRFSISSMSRNSIKKKKKEEEKEIFKTPLEIIKEILIMIKIKCQILIKMILKNVWKILK